MKIGKKPVGYCPRLGVGVESPVVREDGRAGAEDLPFAGGRELSDHVVVAREARAHQVLRARLHPLDGPAEHEGGDGGADIARVDGDLVPEAAADVGGDYSDLVFWQSRDDGEERPVGVRGLGGQVYSHLAGRDVVIGDGPAGLHRGGVDARIVHLLAHLYLSLLERLACRLLVPRIPEEDGVIVLAILVVADDGSTLIERLPRIYYRVKGLVIHLNKLEGVLRDVGVIGHHEGDLLPLKAHLVGCEHGLGISGEGGHPGEALLGEVITRDDRVHAGELQRGARVHTLDPRVGVRTAQDGRLQHLRQPDVVDVVSLAPDKAPILLARHPVAEGMSLHRSHYAPTSCVLPFLAAHWTALTMFS